MNLIFPESHMDRSCLSATGSRGGRWNRHHNARWEAGKERKTAAKVHRPSSELSEPECQAPASRERQACPSTSVTNMEHLTAAPMFPPANGRALCYN